MFSLKKPRLRYQNLAIRLVGVGDDNSDSGYRLRCEDFFLAILLCYQRIISYYVLSVLMVAT